MEHSIRSAQLLSRRCPQHVLTLPRFADDSRWPQLPAQVCQPTCHSTHSRRLKCCLKLPLPVAQQPGNCRAGRDGDCMTKARQASACASEAPQHFRSARQFSPPNNEHITKACTASHSTKKALTRGMGLRVGVEARQAVRSKHAAHSVAHLHQLPAVLWPLQLPGCIASSSATGANVATAVAAALLLAVRAGNVAAAAAAAALLCCHR